MDSLESFDVDNLESLVRLFNVYATIPEGVVGFRFVCARRLITVALGNGVDCAQKQVSKIRATATLTNAMVRQLEGWTESASPKLVGVLPIDGFRFRHVISKEVARLKFGKQDVIRNTVRQELESRLIFKCFTSQINLFQTLFYYF